MLSLIPTVANWRDCRRRHSGAPNKKKSRGRDAPHIGQDRQYGREASPGQDTAIRREASPIAEDNGINREHGAFRSCVAKHADLTDKTKLV